MSRRSRPGRLRSDTTALRIPSRSAGGGSGRFGPGEGYSTSAVYHTEIGGWGTLGPLCDLPIYNLGSIYPSLKRDGLVREAAANRTQQAWYYWQCWTENPIQNRLLAGLYLCNSGLNGVSPWDYRATTATR